MSLRGFLCIIALTDLLAWGSWLTLVNSTGPENGFAILALFYASFLLALLGLCAVVGFGIRVYIHGRDEIISLHVKRTFRQAFFFSLLIVTALFLTHAQFFHWWTLLLIIALLGFFEQLMASREHI